MPTWPMVPLDTQADFWPVMTSSSPWIVTTQLGRPYSPWGWKIMRAGSSASLPWSGSVIIQQPSLSSRAMPRQKPLPRMALIMAGISPAPMEIARPASPQPSSSNRIAMVRARSKGSIASRSSTPKPSAANWPYTPHSGEPGAIMSSGAMRSSSRPTGRSTSLAKRRTVAWTAAAVSEKSGSAPRGVKGT